MFALAIHTSPRGQPGEQKDTNAQPLDKDRIFSLVQDLVNPEEREQALLILSKNRDSVPDLAPILWYSFGTMTALLQEIISIYPVLYRGVNFNIVDDIMYLQRSW